MPKVTRPVGPSHAGGTIRRDPVRMSGVDLEVGGPTAEILASSATIGTLNTTTLTATTLTAPTTTATSLTTGTLAVTGDVTVRALPLAQYLRLSFKLGEMEPTVGQAATKGTANGYPSWDFANGVDQSVDWVWAPPKISDIPSPIADAFWNTLTVALVWINRGAGSGNVRWQVEFFNYGIGIDAITEAAAVTNVANVAASAQNVQAAVVIGGAITLSPAFFGSEYKMRISRLGSAAGQDTLTNPVGLGLVSFNRPTP